MQTITLTSDFPTPYPAAMKGVLAHRTDATLLDIGHDFPRQNVRSAAFWLRETLPYCPSAVHLAVVDPGVGTDRRALVIRAGDHALVGPDNGLLRPAARRLAHDELEAFVIDGDMMETPVPTGATAPVESHTFDGRDLFAPAAAAVFNAGIDSFEALAALEPVPLDDVTDIPFPEPQIDARCLKGTVLVVDGFGNVITNLPGRLLKDRINSSVTVNGDRTPVVRSYAHCDPGDRLVTVGSHGSIELAVNQGRGDEAFDLESDEAVTLELE